VLTRTSVEPGLESYSSSPCLAVHRTTCAATGDVDKGDQLPMRLLWTTRIKQEKRFTHVGAIKSFLQDGHRVFLRTDIFNRLRSILFHPGYYQHPIEQSMSVWSLNSVHLKRGLQGGLTLLSRICQMTRLLHILAHAKRVRSSRKRALTACHLDRYITICRFGGLCITPEGGRKVH
jgi:hypothetical protein